MKNTEKKYRAEIVFFSHVFCDDVLYIIFDNVLLRFCPDFSIFYQFYSTTRRPTNDRYITSNIWRFPSFYFDHRLMKVLLIFPGRKYVPRVFLWRPDQWYQ